MHTPIQAVDRAIAILACFDSDHPDLSVAEVASRLQLNRSTTWRYLHSLTSNGMLVELDRTGRYTLGPRTLQIAEAYTSRWRSLADLASGQLSLLRDTTGETAALHVRHAWSRLVVAQVESRRELHRRYRDLGEPIPLHLGAPSMALLAFAPEEDQVAYLDSLAADEPNLVESLARELGEVRNLGYAVSRRTRTADVASVAAPVLDHDGAAIAAVNVTGPVERFDSEVIVDYAKQVMAAAKEIAKRLSRPSGANRTSLSVDAAAATASIDPPAHSMTRLGDTSQEEAR